MKSLRWFSLLFPLLMSSAASEESPNPAEPACTIKAWVRAPDLNPGTIIPGQVRIQAKGSCETFVEYSLVLRFKERVWVKVLKPGVGLAEKLASPQPPMIEQFLFGIELPIEQECADSMDNESLWTVAEEERVAFETRYKLFGGLTSEDDLIRDFALLVPTTNYPPSERIPAGAVSGVSLYRASGFPILCPPIHEQASQRVNEHIYMYTVEAKFLNGTTIEVPAGYSAFNTLASGSQTQDLDNAPEVVTLKVNFTDLTHSPELSPNPLNLSFDINVTFPHGHTWEQGTDHDLTFTLLDDLRPIIDGDKIYRVSLTPPLITSDMSSEAQVTERLSLGSDISIPSTERVYSQLSPTRTPLRKFGHCSKNRDYGAHWTTTTSESFNVESAAFPSFDMYYQSLEPQLRISLGIQLREDYSRDIAADADYYWTPAIQPATKDPSSSRNVKMFSTFRVKIPISIYPKATRDFHVTHYLSPDARQPVFVDPSMASELLDLSVEERDLLAPKSVPDFKKDVTRQSYYSPSLYYVGDTWLRKVVNVGDRLIASPGEWDEYMYC